MISFSIPCDLIPKSVPTDVGASPFALPFGFSSGARRRLRLKNIDDAHLAPDKVK
ncbi:MAG: hypothetical protein ACU84H_17145 [Gammaproteobacteria bacterium]